MKTSVIPAVALVLGLSPWGFAQTSASVRATVLELHLQPEFGQNKIPKAFTVAIVNKSDHDVRLPMPDPRCGDVPYGTVKLHVSYKPSKAGKNMIGGGCFADYGYTPILDRVKEWKVLGPEQSLILVNAPVMVQDAGIYDIWASYVPPGMPKADEDILREAGIDFPRSSLESPHVSFVRER